MQENILFANVKEVVNAGEYFGAIVMILVNTGEYLVGYYLAISECWRIFC